MSARTKIDRSSARARIVDAANRHRRSRWSRHPVQFVPPAFSMRTLQLAVCVCRRNRLVKPEILTAAGFRASAR